VGRDVFQMIVTNVRHPRDFRGDLAAMIGSALAGERRLLALAAEFGWPVADAAIEAVLDGAERQTRSVIAQWKDGVYHGEALLDDDGRGNDDIHIRAMVEKRGSNLVIDLSDSHAEVASFVNSSYSNMRSAMVSYLIDPDTPKNRGGPGGVVEMVVETAEPALANTAGGGVRHGACGILGGADGAPHRYMLYSDGLPSRAIRNKEIGLEIRPGDVLVLESGGGGGWGDPAERGSEAIAGDVENGFVSAPARNGEG
jgi:N-methylhydantoinase B/oxoprolinase/acetone carboxylase alpha subunit